MFNSPIYGNALIFKYWQQMDFVPLNLVYEWVLVATIWTISANIGWQLIEKKNVMQTVELHYCAWKRFEIDQAERERTVHRADLFFHRPINKQVRPLNVPKLNLISTQYSYLLGGNGISIVIIVSNIMLIIPKSLNCFFILIQSHCILELGPRKSAHHLPMVILIKITILRILFFSLFLAIWRNGLFSL